MSHGVFVGLFTTRVCDGTILICCSLRGSGTFSKIPFRIAHFWKASFRLICCMGSTGMDVNCSASPFAVVFMILSVEISQENFQEISTYCWHNAVASSISRLRLRRLNSGRLRLLRLSTQRRLHSPSHSSPPCPAPSFGLACSDPSVSRLHFHTQTLFLSVSPRLLRPDSPAPSQ